MLKGISPYLSPDLLKTLYEMGHADDILLADAHFPRTPSDAALSEPTGLP